MFTTMVPTAPPFDPLPRVRVTVPKSVPAGANPLLTVRSMLHEVVLLVAQVSAFAFELRASTSTAAESKLIILVFIEFPPPFTIGGPLVWAFQFNALTE